MDNLKKFWINPAEAIFFISSILFIVGTVNIFSASFVIGVESFQDSYFFIKRHLISFGIGLITMLIAAKTDYRRLRSFNWQLAMFIICLALLVAVNIAGVEINGAKRWLQIKSFRFQPSELVKLVVIIITSFYLGHRLQWQRSISLKSWPVVAVLIMGALVLKQPDMGTAVIIVGLSLFLYLLAGISYKEIAFLAVGGLFLVIHLIFNAAYRAERIMAWINPWEYHQTSGYQAVQSLLAIGSGGFGGVGLGMGASKFHYLPEAHTDFAFAVLCQELGFLGALLIFILLVLFCWYGFKIALAAPDYSGAMLGFGITILIVGQAIGNIAMVSGVLPVTGVPLPFISFGGTALVVNMISVGLLINIGRQSAREISEANKVTETPSNIPRNTRPKLRLAKKPEK